MMIKVNSNYFKLEKNYIFSEVAKRVNKYSKQNSNVRLINLGIGDVRLPLPQIVSEKMACAAKELANDEGFKGYGPEQGYKFLREEIIKNEYENLSIKCEEIFISDGTKCDVSDILDLFEKGIKVGIQDPTYPVYLETNIIAGNDIFKINSKSDIEFMPQLPKERVDVMYLCMPNNPTGTVLSFEELKKWVNYAKNNNSILLYDGAYEKYIQDADIPHSIYEIQGAKDVAIEFRSFSKAAGFTGIRCSYIIIPNELQVNINGEKVSLNKLWKRRCCTKFNGVSYITQVGAAACFLPEARKKLGESICYYMKNAKLLREKLVALGYDVFGGENSPYIWLRKNNINSSWELWNEFLNKYGIITTPGIGFGNNGESFVRISAFCTKDDTKLALDRLKIEK